MWNTLHCENNLKLLERLPDKSIDLIYCDILFGTGIDFGDYKDLPHDHTAQGAFYIERFLHMKRVLKNTGLIYIHTGVKNSHWIRGFLDFAFGDENFRNEIIWQYNSAPRRDKDFGNRHDIILRYSKTKNYYFNEDSPFIREPYSLTAPRGYEKDKYYDKRGKIKGDVWNIKMIAQNDKTERVEYATQKPLKLLGTIIDPSCPPDGVVADFFLGSGTTIIAAQRLNRKWIGCDINPKSIEVTKERLDSIMTHFQLVP